MLKMWKININGRKENYQQNKHNGNITWEYLIIENVK